MMRVYSGVALLAAAIAAVLFGRSRGWNGKQRAGMPAVLAVAAFAVGLPPLAMDAYPETYRKTPVPFDTISIANGSASVAENCVACHGPQGKGDGVMAKSFPKPPVDMLTEPHTAKHTAGDFFHWLTFGIPDTGMPLFADKLCEEDRWDVVNYLHAMSRGYQARLMSPSVKPEQPQLYGPAQFLLYRPGWLKRHAQGFPRPEERPAGAVLLAAIARAPAGTAKPAYPGWPRPTPCCWPCRKMTWPRRTWPRHCRSALPGGDRGLARDRAKLCPVSQHLDKPDLLGEGTLPRHLEFLIDRFGYLRARWIPDADGPAWNNTDTLLKQIAQLNREKEILPPPGDHVH